MKKLIYFLVLLLSFTGCKYNIYNPPKVSELDPVAIFGMKGKFLEGRLFESMCQSNAFGSQESARKTSLKNAAKKAKKLGYKYFTVLDRQHSKKDNYTNFTTYQMVQNNTNASVYGTGGYAYGHANTITYVPQDKTLHSEFHTYSIIFLLLNENELDGWNNIYEVEKYL